MVRQNEQVTPAVDAAYEQMWNRASQRQQRGVEERFVESLGAARTILSASSTGNRAKLSPVARAKVRRVKRSDRLMGRSLRAA